VSTFRNVARLLRGSLHDPAMLKQLYRSAGQRIKSDQTAHGLKRDLDLPHTAPEALIPITVRPIRDEDVQAVLESADSMTLEEKWDRDQRLRLLQAGVGSCFVAVTADDVPCYTQWLFSSKDNEFLRSHFNGTFPPLDADTALLEGAYTPTAFRGQRIMSAAMSLIAEQGRSVGVRYVTTFVGVDNTASLKGCYRAGFEVYLERRLRWRMGRSSVTFQPLTPEASLAA
jgi:RimJ/RimL family protein N-acetyltransferase